MRRRQVLRNIGAASIGTTVVGSKAAASTSNDSVFSDEEITINRITGSELNKLKGQIFNDHEVRKLLREAIRHGWRPDLDSIKAIRRSVSTDTRTGSFDTAVLHFRRSGKRRASQKITQPPSSGNRNQMLLQWVGNDTLDVEEVIDEKANTPIIAHLKYKSDSDLEYNLSTGPVADEVTIFEVENGEVISETASPKVNQEDPSNRIIAASSSEYCEVGVDVYEGDPSSPCWDLACLFLSGLSGAVTAAGCIATGGLLCLAGGGVTLSSVAHCMSCPKDFTTTVEVEKDWLEEKSNYDNPCDEFSNSRRNLVVVGCEFYEIPTKEDYDSPEC